MGKSVGSTRTLPCTYPDGFASAGMQVKIRW